MFRRSYAVFIPALLVLALVAGISAASAAETETIQVTAKKYEFIPGVIKVHQGDTVVLNVTAIDTDHGLGIKAFGIDQLLPKGKTVTVTFVANKKGEFVIKCTHYCGWLHFFMRGKLVVS